MRWLAALLLVGGPFLPSSMALAGEARIAVASNFAAAMPALAARFRQETGHALIVSTASTGKLYAQIIHGAPFDVFLAADDDHPRRLEQDGLGIPGSRFTYAVGRLALWSPREGYVDEAGQVLKQGVFRKLALANPRLAPYGMAAQDVLDRLGLWTGLQDRLVLGENIAQTYQFVASGNAELGFVALSQVQLPGREMTGSMWRIPQSLYDPIRQDAVLLKAGKGNPAASALLEYLKGAPARQMITAYGYATAREERR